MPSVERGIEIACLEGILAGYRVVDVEVDFYDGKMHPVDSNDISFQVAGYWAFKEAFLKARPCLLEPINEIEVRIPEDCMGKSWAIFPAVAEEFSAQMSTGNLKSSAPTFPRWNSTATRVSCARSPADAAFTPSNSVATKKCRARSSSA